MIGWVRFAGDLVAVLGFATALVFLFLVPTRRGPSGNAVAKWVLAGAFGLYVLVEASVVLAKLGLPHMSDLLEDNFEVIFPLFALGAVFAAYNAQQLADSNRARRALTQQHDLMMDIVDAAPAGIVVLGPGGTVTFANGAAKDVLALREDLDTGALAGPGWVADGSPGASAGDLRVLLATEQYEGRPLMLRWPDGRTVHLRASGRPMLDARGELGGIVVAFERPSQDD